MEIDLNKIKKEYSLEGELDLIVKKIKEEKPLSILLQFPDGLKIYATKISEEIKKRINKDIEIKIWLGSCFGACDIPNSDSDLLIQFGHAPWEI